MREFRTQGLGLDGTRVTDRSFRAAARIRTLRQLSLADTQTTPGGLEEFLERAPKPFSSVIVPSGWEKNPELLTKLEGLMARYPSVEFSIRYHDGNSPNNWRDVGEPERRFDELWGDGQVTERGVESIAQDTYPWRAIYVGGTGLTLAQLELLLKSEQPSLKVVGVPESFEDDPEFHELVARHPQLHFVVRHKPGKYWESRELALSGSG